MDLKNKGILVAYFSHAGENYKDGGIITLKKGNTKIAAETVAQLTGGMLFEIRRAKDYPFAYRACVAEAQAELAAGIYPELAEDTALTGVSVLYICYPNWCGTMPMPVWSFLTRHDLRGKKICPLCTNEGSGMGRSESDLRELCHGAELRKGLPVRGSAAEGAEEEIRRWVGSCC